MTGMCVTKYTNVRKWKNRMEKVAMVIKYLPYLAARVNMNELYIDLFPGCPEGGKN